MPINPRIRPELSKTTVNRADSLTRRRVVLAPLRAEAFTPSPAHPLTTLVALLASLLLALSARAQIPNPVYVDVSPVARDALVRAREMAAGGNLPQAARELQRLLDEHADRVVPVAGEPDLLRAVRAQAHVTLLENPELLAQYLAAEEPRAREILAEGTLDAARRVESSRLLTTAGFEAVLRVAQSQLEAACFEAARITLEQLESHPFRRDPAGHDAARHAAELMARVVPYLEGDRGEARERAARWGTEAGLDPRQPGVGAERPPAARVTSVLAPAPPLDAPSVPNRPLWSAPVEPPEGTAIAPQPPPNIVAPGAPKDPESLWVLPTVAGDTLYLNDGTWITARDRFTLQLRWAVEPGSAEDEESRWSARTQALMRGASRQVEDTNSVTIAGRIVLATTGVAREGSRDGDARTHALDAESGKVLWSAHVPDLDPQLLSGSVRGPVMVDGDTVIVAVRKSAMARRIVSVYLVGLELRTGTLRWVRLIASAGALPFNRERRISDACALDQGVVYVCDQLGAAAAVEASTGRPIWVRRMPVAGVAETGLPWRWSSPIALRSWLIMLSPDHRELLRLDRHTGEIHGKRAAGALGEPDYLVLAGDRLGAVGDTRIAILDAPSADTAPVTLTRGAADPGIRARVVVAGDRLLVPRPDGLSVIDPRRPETPVAEVPLEAMGTVLPIENQLLVIDSRDVHSYLAWPVAQSLLRGRMTRDPLNPEPACTYAELAYRAGKPEEVAPAADLALDAIERDPEAHGAVRARLFGVLREMVDSSQERWVRGAPYDPRTPVLDPAVLAAVIDRLGRSASGPEDRVTHLMALGRLREAELIIPRAIEAYQRILADTALAAAYWRGPGVRVRAELEATSRIRRLVTEHGAGAYAPFDAEAAIALAGLGPTPTVAAMESVARRYPASNLNPSLWLRVAGEGERAAIQGPGAVEALREGLAAIDLSRLAGRTPDPTTEAELAGRLITELIARDRVYTASRLIAALRVERPNLVPTNRGAALDIARLASELTNRLAALQRLPRIGRALRPEVQALDGWSIMEPVSVEGAPVACEHVMLTSLKHNKVALWGIPGGIGASQASKAGVAPGGNGAATPPAKGTGPEYLAMLWSRDFPAAEPRLLRVDPKSVYLMWDGGEQGPSVERIDAVTGATVWRTDPLRTLFAAEPGHRERLEIDALKFETPIDSVVEARAILWAIDERAMIVAERIGRIAAFDPETGRLLWKQVSPISRLHDLDAAGGLVAIGGAAPPAANPAAIAGLTPMVRLHDARTGELVRSIDTLTTPLRWLRLVPSGATASTLVLAEEAEITALDAQRAAVNWSIPGGPAFGSIDAWIFGERMFVLTRERDLWFVSLSTGRAGDAALDTFGRLADPWALEVSQLPPDPPGGGRVGPATAPAGSPTANPAPPRIAFRGRKGILIFDPGKPGSPPVARLVGIDALTRPTEPGGFPDSGEELVPPVAARGVFVTMEAWQTRLSDGRPAYAMHLLDAATGKLQGPTHHVVLWDTPRKIAVLDGRIIVTSGSTGAVTTVYSAPE